MSKELQTAHGHITLVDDADAIALVGARLRSNKKRDRVYVNVRLVGKTVPLHRFLLSPPEGMFVDHINNDPLDNRRCNLRVCTHAENQRNKKKPAYRRRTTSKYMGVFWRSAGKRHWLAQIGHQGHQIHIGSYATEVEAAMAYDDVAKKLHGAFASLNFRGTAVA